MRFNTKELAHYASTRFGKADKEGALWMKECEGILKKKESECFCESIVRKCREGTYLSSQPTHRDGFCSQETCFSTAELNTL